MAELRLCPFCGGNARIVSDTEATKDSEGRLWAFTVVCDKCCARKILLHDAVKDRNGKYHDDVIYEIINEERE